MVQYRDPYWWEDYEFADFDEEVIKGLPPNIQNLLNSPFWSDQERMELFGQSVPDSWGGGRYTSDDFTTSGFLNSGINTGSSGYTLITTDPFADLPVVDTTPVSVPDESPQDSDLLFGKTFHFQLGDNPFDETKESTLDPGLGTADEFSDAYVETFGPNLAVNLEELGEEYTPEGDRRESEEPSGLDEFMNRVGLWDIWDEVRGGDISLGDIYDALRGAIAGLTIGGPLGSLVGGIIGAWAGDVSLDDIWDWVTGSGDDDFVSPWAGDVADPFFGTIDTEGGEMGGTGSGSGDGFFDTPPGTTVIPGSAFDEGRVTIVDDDALRGSDGLFDGVTDSSGNPDPFGPAGPGSGTGTPDTGGGTDPLPGTGYDPAGFQAAQIQARLQQRQQAKNRTGHMAMRATDPLLGPPDLFKPELEIGP